MDIGSDGVAEHRVEHAVPLDAGVPRERLRHDGHAEVTAAASRTGVAAVAVPLIEHVEMHRGEGLAEGPLDLASAPGSDGVGVGHGQSRSSSRTTNGRMPPFWK